MWLRNWVIEADRSSDLHREGKKYMRGWTLMASGLYKGTLCSQSVFGQLISRVECTYFQGTEMWPVMSLHVLSADNYSVNIMCVWFVPWCLVYAWDFTACVRMFCCRYCSGLQLVVLRRIVFLEKNRCMMKLFQKASVYQRQKRCTVAFGSSIECMSVLGSAES